MTTLKDTLPPGHPAQTFHGIVPPMITPLRARDQLDQPGLERLIEHILSGGVHGLFILGTSGEAPNLSHQLRRDLIAQVCRQVRGRVPVLVGITDTSVVEALAMARHAAESGAQAVVTAPPYYFPAGQPELIDYVELLVRELPLPLFLYNMPQMTKVEFAMDTLRKLAEFGKIVGVKDSSGNLPYLEQVLELKSLRPDWSIFVGPENLLTHTLHRGGAGGVNGGANVFPSLFVELYAAVRSGNTQLEAQLQEQLLKLGKIYSIGRHASAVIKGMKCACSLLGICDDLMAEPFARFNPPERAQVRAVLESLGLAPNHD